MFDYFEQFNNLDPKIKEKVSNQFMVAIIDELEKKYGLDLAAVVMMVTVKAIPINDLAIHLSDRFSLSEEKAKSLASDLKEKVFLGLADYLGMDISQLFGPNSKVEPKKELIIEPISAPVLNEYGQEIDNIIRATIIEMNLGLSLDMAEKLASALKLYWRDVRNKIDTRALLVRAIKDGGFSLSETVVDSLLRAVDNKKNNSNSQKQTNIKKPSSGILEKISQLAKNSSGHEADYSLASFLDTKHELSGGLDVSHEISPAKVAPPILPRIEKKPDLSSVMEKEVEIKAPQPIIAPAPVIKPRPVVAPVIPAAPVRSFENKINPRVEDIKPVRIMNPIDELRYMDLTNFRRIAKDPIDITKKVKSRIKLLEGEDYEKGLAGITAWRQSPVNKLYLKIINSSLSNNQTISQVIDDLKGKKQDYLTLDEVEAVISLNSELKF